MGCSCRPYGRQCKLVLWRSQQRARAYAFAQFGASLLNMGLSLLAVLAFGWGAVGRNFGIATAALLVACFTTGLMLRAGELTRSLRPEHMRMLVAFGASLIPHALAGVLVGTMDRWAVSIQLGAYELGIYAAAAQLGTVMAILADAFGKAYSPWLYGKLSSAHASDKRRAVGAIYVAMPGFLCVALVLAIALVWLSGALLGPRYQAAGTILPWFVLGGAFNGMYVCTSSLYFFSGRTALLASRSPRW